MTEIEYKQVWAKIDNKIVRIFPEIKKELNFLKWKGPTLI